MLKKILYSILLLAIIGPAALCAQKPNTEETQKPIPMFAEGVKWNVLYRHRESIPNHEEKKWYLYEVGEPYEYGVTGKETIKGKEYFHVTLIKGNKNVRVVDNYFREEGQKVYFYDRILKQEVLLFDYNIKVGDNFIPYPSWGGKSVQDDEYKNRLSCKLHSIKTIKLGGKNRRCYFFKNNSRSGSSDEVKGLPQTTVSSDDIISVNDWKSDYIWIEGIGTKEDSPFFLDFGIAASLPDMLLTYVDANGVESSPHGYPANYSYRNLLGKISMNANEISSTTEVQVIRNMGTLEVTCNNEQPHNVWVYTLNGECLVSKTLFTHSLYIPLNNIPQVPLVVRVDNYTTLVQ